MNRHTKNDNPLFPIVTDTEGRIVEISEAAAAQLQLQPTAVLGRKLNEVLISRNALPKHDVQELQTHLTQTVSELEAIINAIPGMVSVVDKNFRLPAVNQATVAHFGQKDKTQVIGQLCHDLRKGLSVPCEGCGVVRVFETGEPVSRVSTPKEEASANGIATKAYAVPLKDDAGTIWGAVEVLLDITDLKLAEQALRENEARLRTIIEQGADAVYVSDLSGRIISTNAKAREYTGYSRNELLEMTVMDIDASHPTLETCLLLWDTVPLGGSIKFDSRHRRRDGSVFPVEINSSAVLINNEKHILGFARDITDRRAAEEKLRYFKNAVECSTNAVGMATVEGRHFYQNRAFDDLFGEKIGEDPPASIYVQETLGRDVFRTITGGGEWSGEVEMWGKNRKVLTILLHANAIKDDEGNVIGAVGVHSDITARKKAEEERIRLEQQIHKNQKLESLGVLAGGIAHDFNNLLGGIFGFIEIANEEAIIETARPFLAKALLSIERARDLTRQLLTFAKGGAPKKTVQALFPFAREAVEFALSGSNVSARFQVADDLASCSMDIHQIGQVLDNLIINAKQSMNNGGTVWLFAENVRLEEKEVLSLPGKDYVHLSIKDEGAGIPPEVLPYIFDPFFTTKKTGSGLGLTTAYSIIKRHDGTILVSSEPGKGARFDIYLPAHVEPTVSARVTVTTNGSRLRRVLIMDDEEIIRETTEMMCHSLGFDAVCETDGAAAVRRFSEAAAEGRPFCAVILDLTVPGGMGGKEALPILKQMDPTVPVFVCSGYADDPTVADPGAFGFSGGIRKPFRKAELAELLAQR